MQNSSSGISHGFCTVQSIAVTLINVNVVERLLVEREVACTLNSKLTMRTHTHTHARTHRHAHTHACMHARTNTHTRTHTHTFSVTMIQHVLL